MNLEEYERRDRALYEAFAETVASIIDAAISEEHGYKLQQVQSRAKEPASLRQKLSDRNLDPASDITGLKDLAGCRAIFYTNTDVERFLGSGLVESNFDVVERTLHHPHRQADNAVELYMANHYVVRLTESRAALPEYRRFAGLKCEVQVQTILNHSWAATAHDTIYKAPELKRFGKEALKGIDRRLSRVAKKYLIPAGYEFDRIFHDFDRILHGKALFDDNALDAIVRAPNNNERLATLETFADNLLPLYDDVRGVFPEIWRTFVDAAKVAKGTEPIPRETPFGTLPPTTFADILRKMEQAILPYRYVDIEITFEALRELWSLASTDEERKPLSSLADALAKNNLSIWRSNGPAVQEMLVDAIGGLSTQDQVAIAPLIGTLLSGVLSAEIEGTTSTSTTVTIHSGATPGSARLEKVRSKALSVLEAIASFDNCSDDDRRIIRDAMLEATDFPRQGRADEELILIILANTKRVLEYLTKSGAEIPFDERQALEAKVHRIFRMNSALPPHLQESEAVVAAQRGAREAALAFRNAANSDAEFGLYKVLVGFQSVYPQAWERQASDWKADEAYRNERANALMATVSKKNADVWFQRLSRFAETDSRDWATFPVLGKFINDLGEQQPDIVLDWLKRDGILRDKFMPGMLSGLMRSTRNADAEQLMKEWVAAGANLSSIAWYLRFADPFDEQLLTEVAGSALRLWDVPAILNCVDAAVRQYEKHPGNLIDAVFMPVIRAMSARRETSWVNAPMTPWMNAQLLLALNEAQSKEVLDSLVEYPSLEYDSEYIVAALAKRSPAKVLEFFTSRLRFKRTDEAPRNYDAIPFQVYELAKPLSAIPDDLIRTARAWYHEAQYTFQYDGGRLLSCVFPEPSEGLVKQLEKHIDDDPSFVLAVLRAYEGKSVIYDTVRRIVARAVPQSEVWQEAHTALDESGVVTGEFGFAELHAERRKLLAPWLEDESERVREFANEHLEYLKRRELAETRRAEASIAARKLAFGEDLVAEEREQTASEAEEREK